MPKPVSASAARVRVGARPARPALRRAVVFLGDQQAVTADGRYDAGAVGRGLCRHRSAEGTSLVRR
jgi:hypothetical protein